MDESAIAKAQRETDQNVKVRLARIVRALVDMGAAIDFKDLEEIETAVERAYGRHQLARAPVV